MLYTHLSLCQCLFPSLHNTLSSSSDLGLCGSRIYNSACLGCPGEIPVRMSQGCPWSYPSTCCCTCPQMDQPGPCSRHFSDAGRIREFAVRVCQRCPWGGNGRRYGRLSRKKIAGEQQQWHRGGGAGGWWPISSVSCGQHTLAGLQRLLGCGSLCELAVRVLQAAPRGSR